MAEYWRRSNSPSKEFTYDGTYKRIEQGSIKPGGTAG